LPGSPVTGHDALMSGARLIRFCFDYISTNAYIAWVELLKLAAKYDAVVEPEPVLFAGLLEAHGQLGPAEIPSKARWMVWNNVRKAMLLGIPLQPPAFHPFNPLLALRVSSLPLASDARVALITGLFEAVWVHSLHISDPAVVERVANEVGLDGKDLVARAALPETKARLRKQTDDAIARGVFGVPSMEVDGELFWGYDDFPYLELFLAGRDPLAQLGDARASALVAPSAQRRRFR
jgi:2-hydroxychromene-2-carboxylate isomerase